MDDQGEEMPETTLEEKLDIVLARQDEMAQQLLKDHALDADLKRLLKVVLYLVILALVFYVVETLLTPILRALQL
jgi:hypothetical protein